MRPGNFDLVLPRLNYMELGFGPPMRRVRVGFARYKPRNFTRVMDSKTDEFEGRRGPELVEWMAERFPNADIRVVSLRVKRPDRPQCGARCRDGHACKAPAVWDAVRDRALNGRCKLHGACLRGRRLQRASGAAQRDGGRGGRHSWRSRRMAAAARD